VLEDILGAIQSFIVSGESKGRLHQFAISFGSLLFPHYSRWLLRTILQLGTICEYYIAAFNKALAHLAVLKQFDQDSISIGSQRYSRQASDRSRQATETVRAQEKFRSGR